MPVPDQTTEDMPSMDERLVALRQDYAETNGVSDSLDDARKGKEMITLPRLPRKMYLMLMLVVVIGLIVVVNRYNLGNDTAVSPDFVDTAAMEAAGVPVPPLLEGPPMLPDAPPITAVPIDLQSPYPDVEE